MKTTAFKLSAATNVGLVRKNNEDNFIVCPNPQTDEWVIPNDPHEPIIMGPHGCVFAVADGMGGLNAGEVASAIVIDQVRTSFLDADLDAIRQNDKKIEKFLKSVIVDADKAAKAHVKAHPESKGMGTTLILAWVIEDRVHISWCGDSRAYVFNKTSGLIRFSKDHSYVQELVDKGFLDPDLAFDHPDSNIITRCIGDFQESARPDYKNYYLLQGDYVLLCSDGLCGYCRDEEIQEVMIEQASDISNCCKQLILHALNAGGYDNVTLALFELASVEEQPEQAPNGELLSATLEDTCNPLQEPIQKKSSKLRKFLVIFFVLFAIGILILFLLNHYGLLDFNLRSMGLKALQSIRSIE